MKPKPPTTINPVIVSDTNGSEDTAEAFNPMEVKISNPALQKEEIAVKTETHTP